MLRSMRIFPLVIFIVYGTPCFSAEPIDSSEDFFTEKILPLLEANCIVCHNQEFNQGGFDLSTAATFLKGGNNGSVIDAENPDDSLLLKMVKHEIEPAMPFGMDKLSEGDIQTIETWIHNGAKWGRDAAIKQNLEDHWAYQEIEKPSLPDVKHKDWVSNPIDAFVVSKLEEMEFQPEKQVKREILIRRVSLDLTGLPPDPVEVDQFVSDESLHAYEKLVNRLLSSPHFGERWATHWLDLARYADSNGFEKDSQREMWPYRDWVIEAINNDMPFDQFTIEQIAGDLLPGSTRKQKVATGYHRNTMLNLEGGVNQEEYRVAAVIDRTNTTAAVWLGTTMACAQCHDHKFDPFSQEDYFSFYAFFNNSVKEIKQVESFEAQSVGPFLNVPNSEQQQVIDEINPKIEALEAKMLVRTPTLEKAQNEWEHNAVENGVKWETAIPQHVKAEEGSEFSIQEDGSVLAVGENPITDTYHVELNLADRTVNGFRLELLQDDSLPDGGPGRRSQGRFTVTDIELNAVLDDGSQKEIQLINPSADWGGRSIQETIDDDQGSGWGNGRDNSQNFEAVFQTPNLDLLTSGLHVVMTIRMKRGAGETVGKFRISTTGENHPQANEIPDDVWVTLNKQVDERSENEIRTLNAYYRSITPLFANERDQIAALKSQLPGNLASLMVMQEMEQPRETKIFKAGSFLQPGDPVQPGIPAIFKKNNDETFDDRLDLARWLVDDNNPLTARVYVNRIWEQLFGFGIVESTEDFGTRSPDPVNQELLDWLAYRFMEDHWSLKSLLYLIVTSSAYKQDSAITPEKLEADPKNRYVTRGPSFRLRGEFIRDNGLKISGLLNPVIGGESVFPYQPEGIWNMPYSNAKWVESKDGGQFRRGLYTHWQRTATYPTFVNFDAPSRETVCTHRIRTNTPLQALNLLNDPAFFMMAQGLATRMIEEMDGKPEDRLIYGFRICTSRYPTPKELKSIYSYYQKQQGYFKENPDEAKELIKEHQTKTVEVNEHAALVMASNVLLNLHETITKR